MCVFKLLFIHIHILDHIISFSSISIPAPCSSRHIGEQRSHFSVNSFHAHLPLNHVSTYFPPDIFSSNPGKPHKRTTRMFTGPAAQYFFFFFLHCNRQYILLYGSTNSLSPTRVRATSPFGIAFMMHDKAYNSPSPWQHSVSNQSCPKVMTVTTEIITRLFSPPVLLLPFQSCPTILSFFQCV